MNQGRVIATSLLSKLALGCVVLMGIASPVHARLDKIPGSRYTSARAMSMGDAFLPLAEGAAAALFYNPALIAGLRGAHFEPLNFSVEANQDYFSNFSLNFFKATSLSSYSSELTANPGRTPGVGFSFIPTFGFRGFAFGFLASGQVAATASGTNITYTSRYQIIPALGFGLPLARGIVKIGYSLQWVNTTAGQKTVTTTTTPLGYNEGLPDGGGLSHNAGFTLQFPIGGLPTVAIVARNLGGLSYSSGLKLTSFGASSSGSPATEPMSIDASFSLQSRPAPRTNINWVAQLRDMSSTSGFTLMKRLSFGAEFELRNIISLRFGWGSGYPSAGLGFKAGKSEFGLGWWSEEVGTSSVYSRDIRTQLQFAVRAF